MSAGATATVTTPATSGAASSDFNGDGFPDVAIGVPSEDVGSLVDAGAVNVLYGSTSGLQTSAPEDQFWTQDSPGVEDQAEGGDRFGFALAWADFNSDGFADLAIGVPSEDLPAGRNAGAVNVLYGSISGLQTDSPPDQFWNQDSPDVEDQAGPEERFGRSLGVGDFNGDGYVDLAIGVPYQVNNGHKNSGAVSVLYGTSAGLQAIAPDDQFWTQDSPGVDDRSETADRFGWTFGPGDFNGDGYDDLAIGVPMESVDPGVVRAGGAVNVLYGSATGLQTDSPQDQFWNQDSPGVEDQTETRDRMGWCLTAGDFNGDGYFDLAVGVPFEDLGSVLGAGGVNVLYGSATGLQTDSPANQFWTQDSPGVQDQAEERDWFGWGLAAGDFNGDGFPDLAVGVRLEDVGDVLNAGAVNVLYGSATGLQTDSPANQFWTEDSPGVGQQAETEDEFGWAVDAVDFNLDGFADLIVGAPLKDVSSIPDAGASLVLYGSATGLQTDSPPDQFWTQDSPDVEDQAEAGDAFGDSFSGGAACYHPCHAPFP